MPIPSFGAQGSRGKNFSSLYFLPARIPSADRIPQNPHSLIPSLHSFSLSLYKSQSLSLSFSHTQNSQTSLLLPQPPSPSSLTSLHQRAADSLTPVAPDAGASPSSPTPQARARAPPPLAKAPPAAAAFTRAISRPSTSTEPPNLAASSAADCPRSRPPATPPPSWPLPGLILPGSAASIAGQALAGLRLILHFPGRLSPPATSKSSDCLLCLTVEAPRRQLPKAASATPLSGSPPQVSILLCSSWLLSQPLFPPAPSPPSAPFPSAGKATPPIF